MTSFYRIAVNAFKESVREPVYFLMLLAALAMIANYPWATLYVFSEQLKLVVDSSMATTLLFGMVAGVLCASHTVAREMRNGTVLLLLSKPVRRFSFIAGKITGIAAAVLLFTTICNFGSIISVYIATDQFRMELGIYYAFLGLIVAACLAGCVANFWRGSSFPEIAGYAFFILVPAFAAWCILTREAPTLSLPDLGRALTLIALSTVPMTTLAVVFAIRFDVVANLAICTGLFFLGLISSYLFQRPTDSEFFGLVLAFFYAVVPNWQYFWLADAIAVNRAIPAEYVWGCALYVALYVLIASMWAIALFQNKEAAGESRQ